MKRTKYKAELLTVGTELLKGSVVNSNAQFMGRELTAAGFEVHMQAACLDDEREIVRCLGEAVRRSHVVICSGGLGPTPDDVTREAVAMHLKSALVFSKPQYRQIQKLYRRRGRKVPEMVKKEAYFPEKAVPLINRYGVALGFYVPLDGQIIVVLPGVPSELKKMFLELVLPVLKKKFPKRGRDAHLVVRTVGLSEPEIMRRLGKDFFSVPFEFGIYPKSGEVMIRIQAASRKITSGLEVKIRRRLGPNVYAYEDLDLAGTVGKILTRRRRSVAVAESCTGGRLAAALTRRPGSSRFFHGGVVAYHNRVKEGMLSVPSAILKKHGAVSAQTARRLAEHVRKAMGATYGIGITGIAGPTGGSRAKPVGRVYIAVSDPRRTRVEQEDFWGDRGQVQSRAVKRALEFLWRRLK